MPALSTRSDSKDLPPFDTTTGPKSIELLVGEADRDTWRIVELFSGTGLPFDAEVSWSSGSGSGAWAFVTVARAARVSVFARSVKVRATNLAERVNRVGVTVADGFASTRNQWEHTGLHRAGQPSSVPVPPFADTVRFDLADILLSPLGLVRVRDGLGDVAATYPVPLQPPTGIPVGGAGTIELLLAADVPFRAVYHLSL